MTGFVGSRARKKRRNTIFITVAIFLITLIYFIFPIFQLNINEPIPSENIIPDPTEDLTSLASNIEDLELTIFQKDQKIKFRDGQIINLQNSLKETKSKYDLVILELNEIKSNLNNLSSDNEKLISPEKFKSLQEKFYNLNIENDKNISEIKKLNLQLENLNTNLESADNNSNDIIKENQKLKKDNKSLFAKNLKLDNDMSQLTKKITEQQSQINFYLNEIKELKDNSHHGG